MPLNDWLTCVPAYGRDYQTGEAVFADWQAGKDFMIRDVSCPWNGRYVNQEDGGKMYDVFKIRYNKLAGFCIIKLVAGKWELTGKEDAKDEEATEGVETDECTEGNHGD